MIEVYKYLHGLYNVQRPVFNLAPSTGRDLRGNTFKLAKNRFRLNLRGNFFTERVIARWNALPDSVVTAPSLNAFKNRLDSHWKDLPTVYCPECYA
mgnify:FL=1